MKSSISGIDSIKRRLRRQKMPESRNLRLKTEKKFLDDFYSPIFKRQIFSRDYFKQIAVFATVFTFLIFFIIGANVYEQGTDLKKSILGAATAGFSEFSDGQELIGARDFIGARQKLIKASESLEQIYAELDNTSPLLNTLVRISPQGRSLDKLLTAWGYTISALEHLTEGVIMFDSVGIPWDKEAQTIDGAYYNLSQTSNGLFIMAGKDIDQAVAYMGEINKDLIPPEFLPQFSQAGELLVTAQKGIWHLVRIQQFILSLLGGENVYYLIAFQNNAEMRATGGFIGTYGLVEVNFGEIKLHKIESIYEIDGQLKEKIAPPPPMVRNLTDAWALRDSNWFIDFPQSADKMLDFFEMQTGIRASGVLAATPDLFEDVLDLLGPIEMAEYGELLTSKNFREIAQIKTSIEYDRIENRPKKFLADFANLLFIKISDSNSNDLIGIANIMLNAIYHKQLMVYSPIPQAREFLEKYSATGSIKQSQDDYLAIFHSNLGGGKTDMGIEQVVRKEVFINKDGVRRVELKITRRHQEFNEKFFPRNYDFVRVVVPYGSRLISAAGFDDWVVEPYPRPDAAHGVIVDDDLLVWSNNLTRDDINQIYIGVEAGYTFFANWLELSPGEEKTIELTYELPAAFPDRYTHLVQKQPGSRPYYMELMVSFPKEIQSIFPATNETFDKAVVFRQFIESDHTQAIIGK